MQAVRIPDYGDPSVLEVVSVPTPEPGPDEVRIDVTAAGINFLDIEQRRGTYPDAPTPPYIPGIEVVGTIEAVGDAVDRPVGDRVAAILTRGGYAEAAIAPADALLELPDGLSAAEAAAVPVQFLTAHNTLFEWGGLEAGERVLVHAAAGGVGTAAVQLAANAGAEVFGTASTADKLRLAADLGVDHSINYTTADVAEEIAAVTDGAGVDLVLDGVGGEAFYAGLDALADGGRLVTYGLASGDIPTVATPRLLFANQSVIGYHLGHALDHTPDRVWSALPALQEQLTAGDLDIMISERFPLAEAPAAHTHIEDRESVGKVVLLPNR